MPQMLYLHHISSHQEDFLSYPIVSLFYLVHLHQNGFPLEAQESLTLA